MLKKYKIYTVILWLTLAGSLGALIWHIVNTSPYEQPVTSLGFFYILIFVFGLSLTTLIGFFFRRRFGSREQVAKHFRISLRQGILISITGVASLILQSLRLFSWTNMGLLLIALFFLEFFFITNDKKIIES